MLLSVLFFLDFKCFVDLVHSSALFEETSSRRYSVELDVALDFVLVLLLLHYYYTE